MMHENNCKVIHGWSKVDYAYANNWASVHSWISLFLPEATTTGEDYDLLGICKHFHEMGF